MSIFGISGRYGGIIPLIMLMSSAALLVALYWQSPERTRQVALTIWLSALAVAAYIVIQQAGLDPYDWYFGGGTTSPYPASALGNSNFAGGFLAIALPLGVYLAATARSKRRPWFVLSLGLEVLALWYTQSRGAFIAAVVGVGTVAWISRDRVPRWVQMVACTATAVLVFGAVAVAWHPWSPDRPGISQTNLLNTTSAEGRMGYWKVAGQVFLQHPFVGTGPETFYATYPLRRQVKPSPDGSFPSIADKPHNIFLEYAANTGVLGLGTYLALCGISTWYGYRRCRTLQGGQRLLLASFLGMLAAYLTQASVSIDVPALALMGWVSIGAIATLSDPEVLRTRATAAGLAPETTTASPPRRWRTSGLRAVSVFGAFVLLVGGLRMLRADVNAGLGRYDRASQLNPLQSEYPYREGLTALAVATAKDDLDEKARYLELARKHLEKALDMRPNEWPIMLDLVNTYMIWGESIDPSRYSDAIVWSQRTLARDPTNTPLRRALDDASARIRSNVSDLEVAAATRSDDPTGWIRAAKGHLAIGDLKPARAALDRALALDPNGVEARGLLAVLPPT